MLELYDCIVIGCGLAGAVVSRELAERSGMRVLIIEKRSHIGGNTFDYYDENNILVHKYGPHIFHTNKKHVYDYLSRFTQWNAYRHEVLADIHGKLIPVPFNLNSLHETFSEKKASYLERKLTAIFGNNQRIPVTKLREQTDSDLIELADYIYENIFLHYTQKQWGTPLDTIDPSVAARVPIIVSRDNRYFQDIYQGMPADGYTVLFEELLHHPKIDIKLDTDAAKLLDIKGDKVFIDRKKFKGIIIFTGALDELFGCYFGRLPYRTLDFQFETCSKTWYQPKGTINYTVDRPFTRITEFKYLTGQSLPGKTTILKEYPRTYTGSTEETPYYPVLNDNNCKLHKRYQELIGNIPSFHILGRLAEYKYYNMDEIVDRALALSDTILRKGVN
jgi:UDP-galactopyranose mutase